MSDKPEFLLPGENRSYVRRYRFIVEFLALRRNTSVMLAGLILAGTGEKLWLGFAPKYLETLGAGVFIIGLFDALQTFLGAIYAYLGGALTDRLGQRRSLLLFTFIALAGYLLVLVWHHWLALLVGAVLFMAWSALSLPATFTVVATSLQRHQHTMGISVQSLVRRAPMMLGPLIGGWLLTRFGWEVGVKYALLLCCGLNGVTLIFQGLLFEPETETMAKTATTFSQTVKSFSPNAARASGERYSHSHLRTHSVCVRDFVGD